jgi:hypothetical protein
MVRHRLSDSDAAFLVLFGVGLMWLAFFLGLALLK